jgi:hypothetical protein
MKSGFNGWNYVKANGQMVSGLKIAPKESTIIYGIELGKPYLFPFWVETPQGATMTKRVEESVKSESRSVIDRIEVQTLPQSKRMQTY